MNTLPNTKDENMTIMVGLLDKYGYDFPFDADIFKVMEEYAKAQQGKEEGEIKAGLQFRLRDNFDKTVFVIEKINGDIVTVGWPGEDRTTDYDLKDVKFRFKFNEWTPLSSTKQSNDVQQKGWNLPGLSKDEIEDIKERESEKQNELNADVLSVQQAAKDWAKENAKFVPDDQSEIMLGKAFLAGASFKQEDAVEFGKWLSKNAYFPQRNGNWNTGLLGKEFTTEQLYNVYLNPKQ